VADGVALDPGYGSDEKAQFDALTSGNDPDMAGEPMEEFDIDFVPVMVTIGGADAAPAPVIAAEAAPDSFEAAPMPGASRWIVRFTPHSELYARANDPLLLFRELATLGQVEVKAKLDEIPPLGDFEPFGVYCSWEITLTSSTAGEAQIAEVFEFVDGNCDLEIVSVAAASAPVADVPAEVAVPSFAELAGIELATEETLDAQVEQAQAGGPGTLLSFADLAEAMKPALKAAPPVMPTPLKQAAVQDEFDSDSDRRNGSEDRRNGVQSIRVDLDKIDRVVNMVGELVITQSMLTQQMDETLRARYQELVRGIEVLAQTTRGLQDSVMAIRAQPVKTVFSRMPRLVRELASKTGKKIRLETIGENTEIDKTIIEQLSDPLTHMIRNSADHGIELPTKRTGAGKNETGVIRLSAEQAGGNILIAVEDDGGGINRERVLQVARDRGVVGPEQMLTDEQIDQLIFAPGFSTAAEVSDISGRGVGMDVVLSNIKKIGGSVHVKSWTGKGTRMTLRLPLTLAVLDVMLVKVASSPYVIPLSSIVETIQCSRANFSRMPTGGQVLQVRGEYVQVVDLAKRFEMTTNTERENRFVVLCEAEGGVKVALIVDDIIGQQQVVIKSLEENFQSIEGIAGGTILGDGNVALIVDVQGLKTATAARQSAA
jgi:two-component system chemotaxis sensor kinase CheA